MIVDDLDDLDGRYGVSVYASLLVERHGVVIGSEDQSMWMLQVHRELTFPLSVKLMTTNWLCPRHLLQVGRSEEQLEPKGEGTRQISEATLERALTAALIAQASLPELDIQGIPLCAEYVTP